METFVLLPFLLLSRVPSDADTWRHGPEYTFVTDSNTTTLEGRSIMNFHAYQVYSTLKCRPWDFNKLRCQFGTAKITIYKEEPEFYKDEDFWSETPIEIRFDGRGIQSLVVPRDIDPWILDMMRAFISQMNFGVELNKLLHNPDGAFQAKESTYLGQCESLVNVFHEAQDNDVSEEEDYEIVPVAGLQKKQGEMLVIEKTKNLENCVDKRPYVMSGDNRRIDTRMLSSRSRIEISDTGFDSYTENLIDITKMGITFSFHEKISLSLISVQPAKEALQPFSMVTTNVSPYAQSEKD